MLSISNYIFVFSISKFCASLNSFTALSTSFKPMKLLPLPILASILFGSICIAFSKSNIASSYFDSLRN